MSTSTLLTVPEVAARWKRSKYTVLDRLRSGALQGFKEGREWRIPEHAVDEYEAAHSNVAVKIGTSP